MADPKLVKLSIVRNKRIRATVKAVKDQAISSVKSSCDQLGDDLAGFALVMWSATDGDPIVSYSADIGPIGPGLIVPYVMDALNRRLTVEMIANGGDEGGGEEIEQ
jgi:hypothetical protein